MEVDNSDETFPDPTDMGQLMQMLIKNVSMFALHTREAYVLPKSTCGNIMNDMSVLFQTFFPQFF